MLPAKTLTLGNMQCEQVRGNSRHLSSRGRLKKGNTLAKRKTVHEVMVEKQQVCTKLPNITTTQLVRRLPVGELKLKGNQSENAFVQQKETWAKARKFPRAALKNESFKVDDEDELNALIVSRLDNKMKDFSTSSDSSINRPFPNLKSKLTGRSSYTGTEDSGFGEENCDLSMSDDYSRNSNHSRNTASGPTLCGSESFMDIRRLETRNFPTEAPLAGRCPSQLVIRRNEVTNFRARMCTQSHLSLHNDMMALKSLTIHNRSQRERLANDLETTKPCEEEKVYKLGSIPSPSISDPSLAILKKKQMQEPLSRRSSGIESISLGDLFTNINSRFRNTFGKKDFNLQEYDSNGTKKCVRFNLDNFELLSDSDVENPSYSSISPRGSNSTSESLREVIGNEKAMDVNSKCEEWLNRWLETVSSNQTQTQPG